MAFTLFPSYVRLFYHTKFAPHTMTIPTLQWISDVDAGLFETHNAGTINALDMITDLATVLASVYIEETDFFDSYVIYNFPSEDGFPQPVRSGVLAIEGGTAGPETLYRQAGQYTITWHTDIFNIFKLVLLDQSGGADFDPIRTLPGAGFLFDLNGLVTDLDSGWAGRDGHPPTTFIQVAITLNERLRRAGKLN